MTEDNKDDYEPKTRDTQEVQREVSTLSSNVLDMLNVKGKVTEPGPTSSPCESASSDSGELHRVRHPWSLYGLPNKDLEAGMKNLKRELPARGWKIEKAGEDSSRNRNLEILAVHLRSRNQLEVTWLKGEDGHEALIEVTLYSRCFVSQ